jgi:predicted PurR-regulated permease PerM
VTQRRITPGQRARRALLVDALLAVLLAALLLLLTAGLGVVAFICLPLLIIGLLWIACERLLARVRLRRRRAG